MRLIDADALISFIDPEHLRHSGELTFSEIDVINMLNHAPTAYDVDKVIAQLEEEKDSSHNDFESYAEEHSIDEECDDWFFRGLDRAIDIVKDRLAMYEDAAEKEEFGRWIPCSERMPENAMNVIAQFSSGTVTELRYAGNGIFEGIYEYSTKVIIAWMPLPKPYREVQKVDAIKYMKEKERMCSSYDGCDGCQLNQIHDNDYCNPTYCEYPEAFPEEAIAIVEKWSAEHPIRTNAIYVAEKLREIGYTVDIEELRVKCPPHESGWYASYKNTKPCGSKPCETCKAWWDERWKEK